MTLYRLAAACAALLLAAAPVVANDSTATMRAGGLVLEKTDGITMLSEDLFVSAKEIRVKYRFVNHTSEPITTLVAFPMPDITGGQYGDVGGRLDDPDHLVPFITWVNDYAVWTQVEHKAAFNGEDITERLTQLGVPLAPHFEATKTALAALPAATLQALAADGLIEISTYEAGEGPQREITPLWTLKTTHYWEQSFYPGEEVAIEHLYAPAIGGAAYSIVSGDYDTPEGLREYNETYCMDDAFVAAARRKREAGYYLSETWIDYVLVTGANWSGPIRDFRLVVDKGSADNLVSFCGEGVIRISPTQFEVRRSNYTPTRDLSVLILRGDIIRE